MMTSVLISGLLLLAPAVPQELPDTSDAVARVERALANYRNAAQHPSGGICVGTESRTCFGRDWAVNRCRPGQDCDPPPDRLISTLLEAAGEAPHSGYVMGHAVFTLTRWDRHLEALQVAQACEAEEWWCAALEILVYQTAGRPSETTARYPAFRDNAPDEALCELQDAIWLLGAFPVMSPPGLPRFRARWLEEGCARRLAASDTIFWLADPLYIAEGNDRRVEHLSRSLKVRLTNEFQAAWRMPNEIARVYRRQRIIRRGPWNSYDRVNRLPGGAPGGVGWALWASEYAAPYHFVPDVPAEGLEGFDRPTWDLMAELEDEGYKPSYGTFHLVPTQLARFREPGEPGAIKVAAAAGVSGTPMEDAAESGYLVFTDGPGSFPLQLSAPFNEGRAVYLAEAEAKPYVVSFEILTPGKVGWHREKIWPIGTEGAGLSDLLLYRPTGLEEPDSLLGAAALMLPFTELGEAAGEVGLYWETYGLEAGVPVEFELEVRGEGGLIDRLLRLLPGGPQEGPGRLAWSGPAGGEGFGRAVILDLRNLDDGSYTIVLRARQEGVEAVETSRIVRVR
jgi:hypothetical protein